LIAVLTPQGPLKLLVEEAERRKEPIPGLVYQVGGRSSTRRPHARPHARTHAATHAVHRDTARRLFARTCSSPHEIASHDITHTSRHTRARQRKRSPTVCAFG
jgi:hypothetical protein